MKYTFELRTTVAVDAPNIMQARRAMERMRTIGASYAWCWSSTGRHIEPTATSVVNRRVLFRGKR